MIVCLRRLEILKISIFFSIFQDILRLGKLHFFLHIILENSYQYIGIVINCSLIFSLFSRKIHHIWRSIPSSYLPDKNSYDIGNKINIIYLMHKSYALTISIQAGAYFIFSPYEYCLCNCYGVLQGYCSQYFIVYIS